MPLDLADLLATPLPPGTKGLPVVPAGFATADVASRGWHLLRDVPMPAAVLRSSAIAGNIAAMQAYLGRSGVLLAPHGKTTMCPQLFERQLDGGAWGITVANATQAQLCHRIGVPRILIANELIGPAEIAMLAAICAEAPASDYLVLVDSVAGAEALQAGFAAVPEAPPARVLIELGLSGGRCGVRTVEQAMALARTIARFDRLRLRGIEGYEGLIVTDDPAADAHAVEAYLDDLVALVETVRAEQLFDPASRPIVSAGGSVYYDLVARIAAAALADATTILVRSGCYLTQDSGFYARALANLDARGQGPALQPALQVWARVLSVPEPGRAILTAGKRDLSFDIDLPRPELWYRDGTHDTPQAATGWRIAQLSDQHAFALREETPGAVPLAVGDLVALGISHPCTTFDKWPLLLEVDDGFRVTGGLRTFF
jgi:D-serine dehydratase